MGVDKAYLAKLFDMNFETRVQKQESGVIVDPSNNKIAAGCLFMDLNLCYENWESAPADLK